MAITLVTKPTALEEAKKEAIEILNEFLKEAEAGDLSEIFVVARHPDATWSSKRTYWSDLPGLIGRLEVAQHSMIKKYLEE